MIFYVEFLSVIWYNYYMGLITKDGKSIAQARKILLDNGYPAKHWASFVVVDFYDRIYCRATVTLKPSVLRKIEKIRKAGTL